MEGCKVQACLEICPFSNGLTRNIVQCLNDYDIPLYLSHTIVAIHGQERVTGITVAKVDDHMTPIPGTEFDIECDTVLLSVGLIPENELSRGLNLDMNPLTNGPVVDQHRETSLDVKSGENVLLSRPLPVAKPSEMIAVEIPAAKFDLIGDEVTVGLVL